jgi:NADH-quinone oxidoreductase subunit J
MGILDVVFYLFAVLIVASGFVVAFSKNVMHAAFSLLFTFFGVAGIYVLLNADFIALTQLMVYIGGVLVLIIFGVMLTQKVTGVNIKTGISGASNRIISGLISVIVLISLGVLYTSSDWILKDHAPVDDTITPIGNMLLTQYLLLFEVTAVLLLIAFVGAALIARRK